MPLLNYTTTPKGGIKRKMRILKSKKALSPVVASIILIAVTVAVSIAVAVWMGALTIGFMGTEQISFTDCQYADDLASVDLTIKNTGAGPVTISKILINGYLNATNPGWTTTNVTLTPNAVAKLTIQASAYPSNAGIVDNKFERGANYAFTVATAKNNQFGPYTKAASP